MVNYGFKMSVDAVVDCPPSVMCSYEEKFHGMQVKIVDFSTSNSRGVGAVCAYEKDGQIMLTALPLGLLRITKKELNENED